MNINLVEKLIIKNSKKIISDSNVIRQYINNNRECDGNLYSLLKLIIQEELISISSYEVKEEFVHFQEEFDKKPVDYKIASIYSWEPERYRKQINAIYYYLTNDLFNDIDIDLRQTRITNILNTTRNSIPMPICIYNTNSIRVRMYIPYERTFISNDNDTTINLLGMLQFMNVKIYLIPEDIRWCKYILCIETFSDDRYIKILNLIYRFQKLEELNMEKFWKSR